MARIRRPGRVEPVPPVYLCVASCPTEAIKPEGDFDFFACYNHTYRDSIPGFLDLVWDLAERPRRAFRKRWTDTQIAALWQALSFKVEYRCFQLRVDVPGRDRDRLPRRPAGPSPLRRRDAQAAHP